MNEQPISSNDILNSFAAYDKTAVDSELLCALKNSRHKIVVLDDDPTGVQTVHGVHVYTDWSIASIRQGFEEENSIFFILTNSRGFTEDETIRVHQEIASNVVTVAKETDSKFILISRGDSTLRGHYPLETEVLKEKIEELTGEKIDGEVILPFFLEGGRYTINNVHYVRDNDMLIPAGKTEFAADRTFGYSSSHLGEWVEEKSKGEFTKDSVTYISLDELRACDYTGIYNKLTKVNDYNKIVVNSVDYYDVKVFVTALMKAILAGKNFLFRSAAALTKVIGGISDKPLLTRDELVNTKNKNGGIIMVGSHVKKTTQQLENLKNLDNIEFIEFNQHLVLDDKAFEAEIKRVIKEAEENISEGRTVAVYTRRERFDLNTGNKEDELRLSIKISDAVTSIISDLSVRPNFIIAKGGITSSDIGTKGLKVKRALVLGQILHGIPVWLTGDESKFPGMPYVIFPGNVGTPTSLSEAVEIMSPNK
ncbi:MAG: hydroxyacid dehydrogenase [Anaerolineaceae bacterium]|nr:MAG: hydroxyacid dehydrogenase [Anaerolineaceae bacterium]